MQSIASQTNEISPAGVLRAHGAQLQPAVAAQAAVRDHQHRLHDRGRRRGESVVAHKCALGGVPLTGKVGLACCHALLPQKLPIAVKGLGQHVFDDVTQARTITQLQTPLSRAAVSCLQQVKVKRRGDDRKFLARVLAVGTECDIALLTVDDDAFWVSSSYQLCKRSRDG